MGTISSLLAEHVSFRCTSVDRIAARGYIPGLQYEGGVVKFLLNRGFTIPSPAALNKNHERLVAELDALVAASGVPVLRVAAFAHVFGGLTNKALRAQMAALWHAGYSSAQATYDLRRLRLKSFIDRTPGTHTYRATPEGLRTATFFTHLASRVVVPALTDLAQLARPKPPVPRPLAAAWRSYEKELDSLVKSAHLAA